MPPKSDQQTTSCTHQHPWPSTGPLMICPSERFCKYCKDAAAKVDHGVASNLRKHVYQEHSDGGQRDRGWVEVLMYRPWAKDLLRGNVNPHHITREEAEEALTNEDLEHSEGSPRNTNEETAKDPAAESATPITSSSGADTPSIAPAPGPGPELSLPDWLQNRPTTAKARKTSTTHSWTSQGSSAPAAKALEAKRALKAEDLAGRGLLAKRY